MVKNLATQIGQVHNQGVQYQQNTDTHLQILNPNWSNMHFFKVVLRESEEVNELESLENLFLLDDSYVIDTKHESTILLGRPFLKTSKALIDVANGSVVLESNREKIELNTIDKVLIPEANATDYVANYLEQIGVDNLETILDGM
ncbi:Adenylosuccinate synthetase, partial [Bienertia sinuspersici]